MRPITRLLPTVTCLLLLTQQAAAQTATLSDLRPSSAVVTNETDEVALQVIEDVVVSLVGDDTILSAAITNEAALRAAGDAAGLDALAGTNAILRAAITDITAESRGKVDAQDGVATNLNTFGWLALPQVAPTNLTYRLVTSNDVILAIGVWE